MVTTFIVGLAGGGALGTWALRRNAAPLPLLAWAQAAAPQQGPIKSFGAWVAACDNAKRCEMTSIWPDDNQPEEGSVYDQVSVSIDRAAGPAGGFTVEIQLPGNSGSDRVQVSTELLRGDHGRSRAVRLLVQDNGPGFADKVLKRAFEPYVTTKTKGTGLGLAVVKKIADEHGARVRVGNVPPDVDAPEGAPPRGARVSLSFPLLADASPMPRNVDRSSA